MGNKFTVKFTNTTSGWDNGENGQKYLEQDKFYDIDYIEIHSMHTRVYLKGFTQWFNSVYFTYYIDGKIVPKEDFWEFVRKFGNSNIDEWEGLE